MVTLPVIDVAHLLMCPYLAKGSCPLEFLCDPSSRPWVAGGWLAVGACPLSGVC